MKQFTLLLILALSLVGASLILPAQVRAADCGGTVKVSIDVGCSGSGNPIYDYVRGVIKVASGIFGLLAVLMVIISGFQLMASTGNPDAVKGAKSRLVNVIISIILFGLMFGILNYLIPGGVI